MHFTVGSATQPFAQCCVVPLKWCSVMQTHAELPITLILGMATSAGALQQMLPVAAASMLEPQHFQLASSMERCNSS